MFVGRVVMATVVVFRNGEDVNGAVGLEELEVCPSVSSAVEEFVDGIAVGTVVFDGRDVEASPSVEFRKGADTDDDDRLVSGLEELAVVDPGEGNTVVEFASSIVEVVVWFASRVVVDGAAVEFSKGTDVDGRLVSRLEEFAQVDPGDDVVIVEFLGDVVEVAVAFADCGVVESDPVEFREGADVDAITRLVEFDQGYGPLVELCVDDVFVHIPVKGGLLLETLAECDPRVDRKVTVLGSYCTGTSPKETVLRSRIS